MNSLKQLKRYFEFSLVALWLGFVAFGVFFVFSSLFSAQSTKFLENFQGAFLGAFFAFLFIRIGEALTKIYERHSKNNLAIVQLQHHFNDCLTLITDNMHLIDIFLEVINTTETKPNEPIIYTSQLHPVPIKRDLLVALINVDFINEVFSINVRLRKLNDSMQTVNSSYAQTKKAFIEKHINVQTYNANVVSLKPDLETFKRFLSALRDEIVKMIAASRILIKDEPVLSKIIGLTFKSRYTKSFKNKLPEEIKRLRKEIEEIAKESRENIERIKKQSIG